MCRCKKLEFSFPMYCPTRSIGSKGWGWRVKGKVRQMLTQPSSSYASTFALSINTPGNVGNHQVDAICLGLLIGWNVGGNWVESSCTFLVDKCTPSTLFINSSLSLVTLPRYAPMLFSLQISINFAHVTFAVPWTTDSPLLSPTADCVGALSRVTIWGLHFFS